MQTDIAFKQYSPRLVRCCWACLLDSFVDVAFVNGHEDRAPFIGIVVALHSFTSLHSGNDKHAADEY